MRANIISASPKSIAGTTLPASLSKIGCTAIGRIALRSSIAQERPSCVASWDLVNRQLRRRGAQLQAWQVAARRGCKTANPDFDHTEPDLKYFFIGLLGTHSKFGVGSLG
jgi:hypothetical protein